MHGTKETNKNILQIKKGEIFENINILNEELKKTGNKMRITFNFAASKINIHELPEVIKKAAFLKVEEISVHFVRYFPQRMISSSSNANFRDSLFFNQELYDSVIHDSEKVAKKYNVSLKYEPIFSSKFKKRHCYQPWNTLLVDWDGYVYPCCGGEVWFKEANGR